MKQCLRYSRLRLRAALLELQDVRDHDYAYSDVHEALDRIESRLEAHELQLLDQDDDPDPRVLAGECQAAMKTVADVLPILGFIVRSAAVRNAFEIYGPLKEIAKTLLSEIPGQFKDRGVKLILSSGWDYMPLTLRPLQQLEEFVFIVLPATESANPLLVPIAGHELGHSVWWRAQIWDDLQDAASAALASYLEKNKDKFEEVQNETLSGQELVERRVDYFPHLARQLEEFFCDFLGLYLFGEAFLHAFTYFLSPDSPFDRSPTYPKILSRMKQLLFVSREYQRKWGSDIYTIPRFAMAEFVEQQGENSEEDRNEWQVAVDLVAEQLVPLLLQKLFKFSEKRSWQKLRRFSVKRKKMIRDGAFRWAVPASHSGSLANLLNAGWDVERAADFWDDLPSLQNLDENERAVEKESVLRELLLKSIEVLEYEDRISRINVKTKPYPTAT